MKHHVSLYTTDCPKCTVLKKKLKNAGVSFEPVYDFDPGYFVERGFLSAPILEVDGVLLDFSAANEWINEYNRKAAK